MPSPGPHVARSRRRRQTNQPALRPRAELHCPIAADSTVRVNLGFVKPPETPIPVPAGRYAPPGARLAEVDDDAAAASRWSALESPATRWVQRIAALALAAAFFLPLSSCGGREQSAAGEYPWNSVGAAVFAVLFFWPLAFEALRAWVARLSPEAHHPLYRLLAAACSSFAIASVVLPSIQWGGRARYGTMVAVLALASYAAVLLLLLRRRSRLPRA